MNDEFHDSFTLSTAEDFVCLAPYLLGYQPQDEIVMIVNGKGNTGAITIPLQDLEWFRQQPSLIRRLRDQRLPRIRCAYAIVVYTDNPNHAYQAHQFVKDCLLTDTLVGSYRVEDTRVWPITNDPASDVKPIIVDPTTSAVSAEMIARGYQIAESRDQLVTFVYGPRGSAARHAAFLYQKWRDILAQETPDQRERRLRNLVYLYRAMGELNETSCAIVGLLAEDVIYGSDLWKFLTTHDPSRDLQLWTQVVTACPDDYAFMPVVLLAMAAWQSDDDVVFTEAMTRAQILDSTHPAAVQLYQLYTGTDR